MVDFFGPLTQIDLYAVPNTSVSQALLQVRGYEWWLAASIFYQLTNPAGVNSASALTTCDNGVNVIWQAVSPLLSAGGDTTNITFCLEGPVSFPNTTTQVCGLGLVPVKGDGRLLMSVVNGNPGMSITLVTVTILGLKLVGKR